MDNTRNIIYCRKISFINYFCHAVGLNFLLDLSALWNNTRNTIVRSSHMSNNAKNVMFLKAISSKLDGKLSSNFFRIFV